MITSGSHGNPSQTEKGTPRNQAVSGGYLAVNNNYALQGNQQISADRGQCQTWN